MNNTYAIVFKGEIISGQDEAAVKQRVGAMFKADDAKVAALFSGKPIAIKKNVDQATAEKFVAAFAKAGAKAYVKDLAPSAAPEDTSTATPPPAAEPTPASTSTTDNSDTVAINPESLATLREAPQTVVNIQPQSSIDDLSMREQGGFLVEAAPADTTPPPAAIDAELAPEGTTIPAPARDTTPAPEPGDWGLSDGASAPSGKASFSLDP